MSAAPLTAVQCTVGNAFGASGFHRVVDAVTGAGVDLNAGRADPSDEHQAVYLWAKHGAGTEAGSASSAPALADLCVAADGDPAQSQLLQFTRLTRDIRCFSAPTYIFGRSTTATSAGATAEDPICDLRVLPDEDTHIAAAAAEAFHRAPGRVGTSARGRALHLYFRRCSDKLKILERQAAQSKASRNAASAATALDSSSKSNGCTSAFSASSSSTSISFAQGTEWQVTQSDIDVMAGEISRCRRRRLSSPDAAPSWEPAMNDLLCSCLGKKITPAEMLPSVFSTVVLPLVGMLADLLRAEAALPPGVVQSLVRMLGGDPECRYLYEKYGHNVVYKYSDVETAPLGRSRRSLPAGVQFRHSYNYASSYSSSGGGGYGKPSSLACRSAYLTRVLNHFDDAGGFEAVLRRMRGGSDGLGISDDEDEEEDEGKATARGSTISGDGARSFLFSLQDMICIVEALDQIRDGLSPDAMATWAMALQTSALCRLKILDSDKDSDLLRDAAGATRAVTMLRDRLSPAMHRVVRKLGGVKRVVLGRFLERGQLHLALSLLRYGDALSVRIVGADLLRSMAEGAEAHDEYERTYRYSSGYSYYYGGYAAEKKKKQLAALKTRWLTEKALIVWAVGNDILTPIMRGAAAGFSEVVGGSSSRSSTGAGAGTDGPHPEILARTEKIVALLAEKSGDAHQTDIVESLWNALRSDAVSASSKTRKSLMRILEGIASTLKDEALAFLKLMISTMPLEAYEMGLVDIVRECAFAEARIGGGHGGARKADREPVFPKLLWRLIMSSRANRDEDILRRLDVAPTRGEEKSSSSTTNTGVVVSAEIVTAAIGALVDVLKKDAKDVVPAYVRRCIDTIIDNNRDTISRGVSGVQAGSTVQCLRLCQRLLALLNPDPFSNALTSRRKVVESLVKDYDLSQFLVDECVRFVRSDISATGAASSLPSNPTNISVILAAGSEDGCNAAPFDEDSSPLSVRLDFLRFIAQSAVTSAAKITTTHISVLWRACLGGVVHSAAPGRSTRQDVQAPPNTVGGRIGSRFLAWLRELLPTWDNSNSAGSNKSTPRPLQAGAAGEIFVSLFCADDDATTTTAAATDVHNAIMRSASKVSEAIALPLDVIARRVRGHSSGNGYHSFEHLLRHVNGEADVLTKPMSPTGFAVVSRAGVSGIRGLDALWTTALEAEAGSAVCKMAQRFLVLLHTNLQKDSNRGEIWAAFASRCMVELRAAMDKNKLPKSAAPSFSSSKQSAQSGTAILELLTTFLEEVERPENHKSIRSQRNTTYYVTAPAGFTRFRVTVKNESDVIKSSVHIVYVPSRTATLGQLRKSVARACNHPPNRMRIKYEYRSTFLHASLDDLPLRELRIYSSQYMRGVMLDAPADDTRDYRETSSAFSRLSTDDASLDEFQKEPRRALSSEAKNFQVFFRLLSSKQEDVVQNAWQLLCRLPVNETIMEQIRTLGGILKTVKDRKGSKIISLELNAGLASAPDVSWRKIFRGEEESTGRRTSAVSESVSSLGTSEVLKLLYTLQIMEGLSNTGEKEDEQTLGAETGRKQKKMSRAEAEMAQTWTQFFIMFGGARYLYDTIFLKQLNLKAMMTKGALSQECLILLLKLLKRFLRGSGDNNNSDDGKSSDDSGDEGELKGNEDEEDDDDAFGDALGVASGAASDQSLAATFVDLDKSRMDDCSIELSAMIKRLLEVASAVTSSMALDDILNSAERGILRGLSSDVAEDRSAASEAAKDSEGGKLEEEEKKTTADDDDEAARAVLQQQASERNDGDKTFERKSNTVSGGGRGDAEGQGEDECKDDDAGGKPNEAKIFAFVFDLLIACLRKSIASDDAPSRILSLIYEFDGFDVCLERGLLRARRSVVREEVATQVQRMCLGIALALQSRSSVDGKAAEKKSAVRRGLFSGGSKRKDKKMNKREDLEQARLNPYSHFLSLVLRCLSSVSAFEEQSDEYFLLLVHLINRAGSSNNKSRKKDGSSPEKYGNLWALITRMIANRDVVEVEVHDTDKFLLGLFRVGIALAKRAAAAAATTTTTSSQSSSAEKTPKKSGLSESPHTLWPSTDVCDQLLIEVFENCLFAVPSDSGHRIRGVPPPPKCKNPRTKRAAAYDLLCALCVNRPAQTAMLCRSLRRHHIIGKMEGVLGHSVGAPETRSATGFVGLRNLGATCYMNSSLQQFYMIPSFRKALVDCALPMGSSIGALDDRDGKWAGIHGGEVKVSAAGSSSSQGAAAGEHNDQAVRIIKQLSNMFIQLQETERRFIDPSAFVASYRDPYGEAIDPRVQADASEFLTAFFQHVDNATSGTSKAGMLRGIFQGTVSNELLLKEPERDGTRRYRENSPSDFFFLSVKVKGLTSLEDSLRDFFSAETVDLRWGPSDDDDRSAQLREEQSKNRPTLKRCSITSLPKHLMIHLQRFQFDYDKMTQVKLNDFFEFPLALDMTSYSQEHRPDRWPPPDADGRQAGADSAAEEKQSKSATSKSSAEGEDGEGGDGAPSSPRTDPNYYQYVLRGIVIHDGTAQAGHYYSYSCERGTAELSSKDPRWFEFNDKRVRPFDISNLAASAFGGEQSVTFSEKDYYGRAKTTTQKMEQTANAFLLIYDRKELDASPSEAEEERCKRDKDGVLDLSPSRSPSAAARSQNRASVPRRILREIWKDNARFCRMKQIFDPAYFAFLTRLISLPKMPLAVLAHLRTTMEEGSALAEITTRTAEANEKAGEGEKTVASALPSDMIYEKGARVRAFVTTYNKWFSGVVTQVDLTVGGRYVIDFDDDTTATVVRQLVTTDLIPPLHPTRGALFTEGERVVYAPYNYYESTYGSGTKKKYAQVVGVSLDYNWVQYSIKVESNGVVRHRVGQRDLKPVYEQNIDDVRKAAAVLNVRVEKDDASSSSSSSSSSSRESKTASHAKSSAKKDRAAKDAKLSSLLDTCGANVSLDTGKLAASFVLGTLCHAPTTKMRESLPKWFVRLSIILRSRPSSELSRWVLEHLHQCWEDGLEGAGKISGGGSGGVSSGGTVGTTGQYGRTSLEYLLHKTPRRDVRAQVGQFLCGIVHDLVTRSHPKKKKKKKGIFSRSSKKDGTGNVDEAEQNWQACVDLCTSCLRMLKGVTALDTNTAQIGAVLRSFAEASPRAREHLLRADAIGVIARFLIGAPGGANGGGGGGGSGGNDGGGGSGGSGNSGGGMIIPFARQLSSAWDPDEPYVAPENEGWVSGDRIKPGTGMPQLTPLLETLSLLVLSCVPPPASLLPPLRVFAAHSERTDLPKDSAARAGAMSSGTSSGAASSSTPTSSPTEWRCPKCTFHNAMHLSRCDVCNAKVNKSDRSTTYAVKPEPVLPAKPTETSPITPSKGEGSWQGQNASGASAAAGETPFWERQDDALWEAIGHKWQPLLEDEVDASAKRAAKSKGHVPVQLDPSFGNLDALGPVIAHRRVLASIVGQLSTSKRLLTVGPMLRHVSWENGNVSDTLVKIIAAGIVAEDYDTLYPFFGAARILIAMQDSLSSARARSLMTAVLGAMHSQRRYLRATESSIEMLLEMARISSAARAWLVTDAGRACWKWVPRWLEKHVNRERYVKCPSGARFLKDQDTDARTMNAYRGKRYLLGKLEDMGAGRPIAPPPTEKGGARAKKNQRYVVVK